MRPIAIGLALALSAASGTVLISAPASAEPGSEIFTWGSNSFGQLGDGSSTATVRGTPGSVSLTNVTEISGGREHVIALMDDGTVSTWGSDANGALGNGLPLTNTSTPITVPNLTGVTDVDDGHYHSLALKSDGTVWGWGQNSLGQLAQGNESSPKASPVQWGSISNAVGVFGGRDMTYVLDASGTLWCSGGQGVECGRADGANDITTPVSVNGLPDITQVAGGRNHGVALTTTGTVWTWGENTSGQLGDNSHQDRGTPQQVAGLSDIVDVGAGADHSMAVTASGEVYVWGANSRGELGLGNTTERLTPVLNPSLSGIVDVDAGRSHSFAIDGDGHLWVWGWNDGRQVNTTTSNVLTPYLVPGLSDVAVAGGGQAYSVVLTKPAPATPPVLADSFDNGLADWAVTGKLQVDSTRAAPLGDVPSARAAVKSRRAAGVRALPAEESQACAALWVRPASVGTTSTVLRLRQTSGVGIAQLLVAPSGALRVRSDLDGTATATGAQLPFSQWREIELCVDDVNGGLSVAVGGVTVGTWSWSTAPVGQVQIGSLKKTTVTANFDDLVVTAGT